MKRLNVHRIRLVLAVSIAAIVLGGIGPANGATITVGPGAGYDFDSIQAGIDAAVDADTVLVAPGEYVITEPITFRGKAITVRSEAGRDETTVRMGTPADINRASVVIFENGETIASVLEGFTITGGRGSRVTDSLVGGGILFNASSGTVRNCAIVQNSAKHGGGVFCAYLCTPRLIDCTVAENSASGGAGGGVMAYSGSSVTQTNCTSTGNSAEWGGGVYCGINSSMTMTDCVITENSTGDSGGGVFCNINSAMTMTNCIIRGNSAKGTIGMTGAGGGVICGDNSSMTMTYCTIVENSAGQIGGGVYSGENSSVTMTHCAVIGNTSAKLGGGLACAWSEASMTIRNCTIWGNSAGINGGGLGCYNGASATVTNSILWGNTAAMGNEIHLDQAPAEFSVTYSNVAGGQTGFSVEGGTLNWGVGNIDADPYFADPSGGDFHLKSEAGRWNPNSKSWVQDDATSPCIDAGDPMSPIGLEPFPNGGFVNMGAYGCMPEASKSYFGEPICGTIVAGDINGDCQVDRADLAIMALHWTDDVPLPLP